MMAERDLVDLTEDSKTDLNLLEGRSDDKETIPCIWDEEVELKNESFDSVKAIFRDIEYDLIEIINQYKHGAIFGCVAWLTSEPILRVLSQCNYVQIIVQKEDFLRPDYGVGSGWKNKLRSLYNNIRFRAGRFELNKPISDLSICGDPHVGAIRCVGNYNYDKKSAFPRSHHKFMVFCKVGEDIPNRTFTYTPTALWTGSYNMTQNAKRSLENVLFIENKSGSKLFDAYLKEHHNIYCMSEPLDWATRWSAPEFRIGT